jgi:hypothetical protein
VKLPNLIGALKGEPAVVISLAITGASYAAGTYFHLNANDTREVAAAATAVSGIIIRHFVTPSTSTAAVENRIAALEAIVNPLVPVQDRVVVQAVEADVTKAEAAVTPPQSAAPLVAANTPEMAALEAPVSSPSASGSTPPAGGWRLL